MINWDTVIVAGIAVLPTTIAAIAGWWEASKARKEAAAAKKQSEETHLTVNSRMTEMVALVKAEASAKATLDEKAAQAGREGVAAVAKAAVEEGKI